MTGNGSTAYAAVFWLSVSGKTRTEQVNKSRGALPALGVLLILYVTIIISVRHIPSKVPAAAPPCLKSIILMESMVPVCIYEDRRRFPHG